MKFPLKYASKILIGIFLQFAGGFDAESMKAFEELRSRVHSQMEGGNKPEA